MAKVDPADEEICIQEKLKELTLGGPEERSPVVDDVDGEPEKRSRVVDGGEPEKRSRVVDGGGPEKHCNLDS